MNGLMMTADQKSLLTLLHSSPSVQLLMCTWRQWHHRPEWRHWKRLLRSRHSICFCLTLTECCKVAELSLRMLWWYVFCTAVIYNAYYPDECVSMVSIMECDDMKGRGLAALLLSTVVAPRQWSITSKRFFHSDSVILIVTVINCYPFSAAASMSLVIWWW